MGLGKTMEAIGLSDVYNTDYKVVIETLAKRLECNIEMDSYNYSPCEITIPEPFMFDFGYSKTYKLYVEYCDLDFEKPNIDNIYCEYKLIIPDCQPNNQNLEIDINPNNLIFLMFLDSEGLWESFFDTVFGDCHGQDHEIIFSEYHRLRHAYWDILTKIGCDKIVIFTHFHYNLEEVLVYESEKINSFNEIIEYAKQMDDLFPINLVAAMNISSQNYSPWQPPEYNPRSCYSYAVVDEADAEEKENDLVWVPK